MVRQLVHDDVLAEYVDAKVQSVGTLPKTAVADIVRNDGINRRRATHAYLIIDNSR